MQQRLLGSDTNPAQILTAPAFTTTVNGDIPDARFGYLSPSESAFYAKASFTNTDGFTYRGGPIRFSATLLKNSPQPQTAVDFIRLLISEQGQAFTTSQDFLFSPSWSEETPERSPRSFVPSSPDALKPSIAPSPTTSTTMKGNSGRSAAIRCTRWRFR